MHEYQSQEISKLAEALMRVQRDLHPVARDSENLFTKSWYASLNSVMEACRETLLANGIWLCQYPVRAEAGHMGLVTKLTHAESGQWQASLAVVPLPKADPQGYGSCITYAKRYALTAMLGMVTEDDDGEGAKVPAKQARAARRPTNAPQAENICRDEPTQGQVQNKALNRPSAKEDFPGLPRIDGISYQGVTASDGRGCIIAVGQTQPKKELLMSVGFRWNAQRKMWWKYADAS